MRFAFFSLRHDPNGASRLHADLMNALIERGHEVFYALPFWLVDNPFWLPCLAEKVNAMRVPRMGGFDAVFYSHPDSYMPAYPLTPLVKACDAVRRFFILRTFLPGHIAIAADPDIEKIATSLWLHEQAGFFARPQAPPQHGNRIHKVLGGVNLAHFRPPANPARNACSLPRVLFRDSRDTLDGTATVREALDILRARDVQFEPVPFGGNESQIVRQYRECDVCVSGEADWGSGWSSSVAEAMACGCSVACGDVPAVRHLAEEGVTARVVPPANSRAMADAVEDLLADSTLRRQLADAAAQRVAQYSTERMAEQIVEIVRSR